MSPTLDVKGLTAFLALSFGLAWLVALPLWLVDDGLSSPLALPLLIAMMGTPTVAALATSLWISPLPEPRKQLGVRLGARRPGVWAFAWLGFLAFTLAAPFVGAAFGLLELDLVGFSGLREGVIEAGGGEVFEQMSPRTLALLQLVAVLFAPLLNAVPSLGEELGWRGYLLPRLLPLGQGPALVLHGAIWGLWHAPVVLLGYNYPDAHPLIGLLAMVGFCVVLGILMGWTRLATGSVWPAVLAHGAINGAAGITMVVAAAGQELNSLQVGVTGWTGWILPVLAIVALVVTGRLPVASPPDLEAPDAATPGPPPG